MVTRSPSPLWQLAADGKVLAAGDGVKTESSTVDNIFAVGDVLHGRPELTPVRAQPSHTRPPHPQSA